MIENNKLFHNFTDTEFVWKRDGKEYTFAAGSVTPMTQGEFNHFAKHLVDQELTLQKLRTDNELKRAEMLKKCEAGSLDIAHVAHQDEVPQIPSVQVEQIPQVEQKRFCEYCVSKGVKHMKECKRPADKPEEKPFADADEASSTK